MFICWFINILYTIYHIPSTIYSMLCTIYHVRITVLMWCFGRLGQLLGPQPYSSRWKEVYTHAGYNFELPRCLILALMSCSYKEGPERVPLWNPDSKIICGIILGHLITQWYFDWTVWVIKGLPSSGGLVLSKLYICHNLRGLALFKRVPDDRESWVCVVSVVRPVASSIVYPQGPSTQYVRNLAPKNHEEYGCWTQNP